MLTLAISCCKEIILSALGQAEFLAQGGYRCGKVPYRQVGLSQVGKQLPQALLSEVTPGLNLKAAEEALCPLERMCAEVKIALWVELHDVVLSGQGLLHTCLQDAGIWLVQESASDFHVFGKNLRRCLSLRLAADEWAALRSQVSAVENDFPAASWRNYFRLGLAFPPAGGIVSGWV